jgi:hypothetical protein
MWINLSKEEVERIAIVLQGTGKDLALADRLQADMAERLDPENAAFADAAAAEYGSDDIEIEGDGPVSRADDGGAWVMAWVYVAGEETEEEEDEE